MSPNGLMYRPLPLQVRVRKVAERVLVLLTRSIRAGEFQHARDQLALLVVIPGCRWRSTVMPMAVARATT
jgi:hypothetical protein